MVSKKGIRKSISLTLSLIMLLSLFSTMNFTSFAAQTNAANLVENGDMENGITKWHSNGGSPLVSASDERHSGNSSIKAAGRTNPWNGVAQVLTDNKTAPVAGNKYHGSAWVMFKADDAAKVTFKLSIKRNDGTEDKYDNIAQADVEKGKWTLLEGDYSLPKDTDVSKGVQLYIESVKSETAPLVDFYADDISFSDASSSTTDKLVALTFDDGPDNTLTALVLDKLEKYKVPATFMMVGSKLTDTTAPTVKRVIDLGCEIGNHSWSYADMKNMSADEVKKSVTDTTYAIQKYSGTTPLFFRPPNLSTSDTMFDVIDMPFASGVTANDWDQKTTAEQRANAIINNVQDGSIILLHDVQPLPHPTPEALDIIIPTLLERGYKFVTLSKLFSAKGVTLDPNDKTMYVTVGVDAQKVEGKDLVVNGNFEDGKNGWSPRGSTVAIESTDVKNGGSFGLKVTGRKIGWNGTSQNLVGNGKGDPVKGKSYMGSAWVMYNGTNAPDTVTFRLSVQWNNGAAENSDKYDTVKQLAVEKGKWTKLEGSYTISSDAVFDKGVTLYVETAESESDSCIDFYIDDVSFKSQGSDEPVTLDYNPNLKALRSVWDPYFAVGAAITPAMTEDPVYSEYLKKHYASLTAENVMKQEGLQPEEGKFAFIEADKIVNYAQDNKMLVRGHALLWHNQVPAWFFTNPADSSKPASSEKLLERIKTHISTVMTHYKGKVHTYDVVNEVLSDNSGLRGDSENSKYKTIVGDVDKDKVDDDYILSAFKYAFETANKIGDRNVKFCINDYSLESSSKKLDAMYDLAKRILKVAEKEGISKDRIVVGFQMHISNFAPSIDQIKSSIEKIASLGVKVQVTELDISIYKSSDEQTKTTTEEILLTQAKRYKDLFDLLKEESKKGIVDTVTLWGTDDGMSWLNDYPVKGRPDAALLFNKRLQAKPAYMALTDPNSLPVYKQQINTYKASPVLGNNVDILWSTVKPVDVNQLVDGKEGTSANIKTMWDSDKLYILAQIADKTKSSKDSLEIFLDKDPTATNDNKQYTIPFDKNLTGDVLSFSKKDQNGYTVQIAVPISALSMKQGDKLGFDLRINNYDQKGLLSSKIVWNDYKNKIDADTSGYGYLVLGKESKLIEVTHGTPVVDGVIDSVWNSVDETNTNVWVAGSSGSTAKFRTLWDEKNLYVLAVVTDSKLSKKSTDTYQQDSVEIFIDQNNGKTTSYEADDYQIRINFDNEVSFDHGKSDSLKSATAKTDTGYIVETAIPLTAIKAESGSVLGFDLQVNNDEDGDGLRDSVSIWCDGSGNTWQNISGIGNLILNKGKSNSNKPVAGFTDISTHWAKDFISELVSKGIVSGYLDGTIKPDNKITRTELTIAIIKALGLKPPEVSKVDFADAKKIPSWALAYIALAKEKGIVKGNDDKTFGPDKNCSRQEAITMIVRAFNLGESSKQLSFNDVTDIQQWSYKSISKAIESELIKGYPDNTFKPGNSITRAELFAILFKSIKK
ncbi:endo-1,4-beta-xylanase [Pseudobacteroides cellulosolvens]|uniref:Beta-xylanase n=1 Tax=Pseudobacteroides cellulosolvens ATCC 35603 = DSM 2933 TaxID=398512 RepID=A0A0L6JK40_9FIRM|nr:endo-1,4-beta-xylanase [Pseudobacteroides cellulosolvens]KNY26226.1 Endo-1,4-beta-xylanase [Pseudobacteroides cellulosolvens ATCC 35603 = DSM 2933]